MTTKANQSVLKAIKVLDFLAENGPLTAHQIARALKLPAATVYSILYALEGNGYVQRSSSDAKFVLGYQFLTKAQAVLSKTDFLTSAKPFLRNLAANFQVNVHYGVLHQWKVLYLHRELGRFPPVVSEIIGLTDLPYCTAIGKALLMGLSEDQLEAYVNQENFIQLTPRTIVDPMELIREVRRCKERGFSLSLEEAHLGIIGIGAPLRNFQGQVIAAISISVEKERYEKEGEQLVKAVIKAAHDIERCNGAAHKKAPEGGD